MIKTTGQHFPEFPEDLCKSLKKNPGLDLKTRNFNAESVDNSVSILPIHP